MIVHDFPIRIYPQYCHDIPIMFPMMWENQLQISENHHYISNIPIITPIFLRGQWPIDVTFAGPSGYFSPSVLVI